MTTGKIALIVVISLLLLIALCVVIIWRSFKNVFHTKRKTKEDTLLLLEERGVYNREDYKALTFEEMKIVSEDGYMLRGQYLNLFPEGKKAVIFIHGYTDNHSMGLQFVEMYKEMKYNILMIDMRSHGESGAMYPTYGIKEMNDVKRWVNAIEEKVGKDIEIGLHGQAMGAATALMYAGEYESISFVVADSPYSNANELLKHQLKSIWHMSPKLVYGAISRLAEKKIGILLDEASPEESLKKTTVPVLFIHGTKDRIMPSAMSEKMYTNRGNNDDKLVLIEDADHVEAYMVDQATYKASVQEFIADK